jgi:hypothetical protein
MEKDGSGFKLGNIDSEKGTFEKTDYAYSQMIE